MKHWVTINGNHVLVEGDGGHDASHNPADATGSKTTDAAIGNDYRGQHTAPTSEGGSPLNDVTTNAYPKDFYSPKGLQYYAPGNEPSIDAATYNKIVAAKGKPNEQVTVYRAVPLGAPKTIQPGDWVTINKQYAVTHGAGPLSGKYAVASARVPAKELFTQGDSFHEWGWQPKR